MAEENGGIKYAVVYETAESGFAAYVPDLPGCVAVGNTLDEVRALIREAVSFHIEGLRLEGCTVPDATSKCDYVVIN